MQKRPNIVFVLTDDQGYGEIGAHGNAYIQTPHLDRMHGQSVRFTNFHTGTTCAPTRAGLLTGHNCNSTGVWHTIGGRSLLRADEWTLADAFKEAGYRTGHFGKWHLGDATPFRPHERGFEYSVAHWGGGIGNTADHWGNDYYDDTYSVNGEPVQFEGFCADVFFSEGMKFIERHKDEPFFCYIASNTPHSPWNIEDKYKAIYKDVAPSDQRARFYGTVTNVDENVGRLRARLDELGLADNTIVIFMSDNGSGGGVTCDARGFVEEGPCNFNAGMRGTKVWEYEGGHRVPFFLFDPRQDRPAGGDVSTLTSYIDFMPTLLDLCGVDVPAARTFHGQSLKPLIDGENGGHWEERILVTDTQRVARPVKWQKSCVMQNRWRLINGRELYDMSRDPGQRDDIAAKHPDVVTALREGYEAWWDLVSEQADRDIPFHIGADDAEVMLTTHDIRNESTLTAWNQKDVRRGLVVSGYWEIDVLRAGRYQFELRRWPRETGHALGEGIEGDDVPIRWDCVQESFRDLYTGGKSIDIRWARLIIGDQTLHAEVDPTATFVRFEVELPEGPAHVYPSFHTCNPGTIAPYYIYVKLVS
ncbi:MAG: arylsulfatase [Kiritimatiellia bacterium]